MSRNHNDIFSLAEINQSYPEEWVAIAVRKTDVDGLPSAGVVLVHDADEQFVWPALKLGEADDLIHVFYTGGRRRVSCSRLTSARTQRAERKVRTAMDEA